LSPCASIVKGINAGIPDMIIHIESACTSEEAVIRCDYIHFCEVLYIFGECFIVQVIFVDNFKLTAENVWNKC